MAHRPAPERATFDIAAARDLARVFVPTPAWHQAVAVLREHNFLVLTGPPEMGKTAIARMLGLARLAEGWEVHECIRPEQVEACFERDRPQLFIADDAFGSTEYRPDAADHWANHLDRILRATDENHWLVWTSRPAPLRAGLRRLHRERGGERFPRAGVGAGRRGGARSGGEDPDAVPPRACRRPARRAPERDPQLRLDDRLPPALHAGADPPASSRGGRPNATSRRRSSAELTEPTEAMAASYAALGREHRELLLAMIDSPPGPVAERDLADALRRHTSDGLPKAPRRSRRPAHRSLPEGHGMRVDWVHPSWRDLVIESLAEDAATRRHFLARCGVDGAAVALSGAGGAAGERERPLLREDADWDALGDGLYRLCHDIDEVEATQLLRVLDAAGDDREVLGLIELVLKRLRWCG